MFEGVSEEIGLVIEVLRRAHTNILKEGSIVNIKDAINDKWPIGCLCCVNTYMD